MDTFVRHALVFRAADLDFASHSVTFVVEENNLLEDQFRSGNSPILFMEF